MTTLEPAAAAPPARSISHTVALAAPLLVVGLAALLAVISDRLLYIGPIDRATFGWLVVIPLWASAPIAAGFGWQRLTARARTIGASACALAVGIPVAALLWHDAAFPNCPPDREPAAWLVPAIAIGVLVGAGFGFMTVVAVEGVRGGHPWRAWILTAAVQVALVFAAAVLVFTLFFGICQRPS